LFEIKVATWGVALWYFHVYMYYNPSCFISSNFLHSTLVPFLGLFQLVKDFYINPCILSISTIFKFLVSFFYPTPLVHDLPLVCPVFHIIAAFVLGLYSTYDREHVSFGLLSLANFTYRWCSSVPSIYLWMTKYHSFLWLSKILLSG
jgi:hypothetical protein